LKEKGANQQDENIRTIQRIHGRWPR